jgi:hypothetical protein
MRYAQAVLTQHGVHGMRTLVGFFALAKKFPLAEIERVASLARGHNSLRLKTLRRLLAHPKEQVKQIEFIESHPLIRDPIEYGRFIRDAFLNTETTS